MKEGGQKEFGETYARSAISNFVDGLFIEVHPDPKNSAVDPLQPIDFQEFDTLIKKMDAVAKSCGKRHVLK